MPVPADKLAPLPRERVGAVFDYRAPRCRRFHGANFPVDVTQVRLNGEGRARLDNVALGAAGDHVGEVVPRARLAEQQHDAGTVTAPTFDGVCILENERDAPVLGRKHGRSGRAREVHARMKPRPVAALSEPRAPTLYGSAARSWKDACHRGQPADVRPQSALTVHAHVCPARVKSGSARTAPSLTRTNCATTGKVLDNPGTPLMAAWSG